jgi:hypothetical protein
MNIAELRRRMCSCRSWIDEEARELKNSQAALPLLFEMYRGLDADERRMANEVIAEWLLSDQESVRFDALALVREFDVRAARTALETLAARLASSTSPSAPYELKIVQRVEQKLLEE